MHGREKIMLPRLVYSLLLYSSSAKQEKSVFANVPAHVLNIFARLPFTGTASKEIENVRDAYFADRHIRKHVPHVWLAVGEEREKVSSCEKRFPKLLVMVGLFYDCYTAGRAGGWHLGNENGKNYSSGREWVRAALAKCRLMRKYEISMCHVRYILKHWSENEKLGFWNT